VVKGLLTSARFVKDPPSPFKSQTEASNAYAAHARQILQQDLETPSISRVYESLMYELHVRHTLTSYTHI
jgi:hypothetical protein